MTIYLNDKSFAKLNKNRFSLNSIVNLFIEGLHAIFFNIFKYNAQYFSESFNIENENVLETTIEKNDVLRHDLINSTLSTFVLKKMKNMFVD